MSEATEQPAPRKVSLLQLVTNKIQRIVYPAQADQREKRDRLRAVYYDRPARLAKVKAAALEIEDVKEKVRNGDLLHPKIGLAEQRFNSAHSRVEECDAAAIELVNGAPEEARERQRRANQAEPTIGTQVNALRGSIRTTERERLALAKRGVELAEANKQRERSRMDFDEDRLTACERDLKDANRNLAAVEKGLLKSREELAALELQLADAKAERAAARQACIDA